MPYLPARSGAARGKHASDIVVAAGWGFLSGLGPIDLEDDRTPLPEGVERQTKKIFENLDILLRGAGLSRANVVTVRVSLVEHPRLYDRFNSAYDGSFPADRMPARSVVGVSHLTRSAQVEMDFVLSTTAP